MEGIVDVYEQYFINLEENRNIQFFRKNNHSCLICREEPKNGSYGKFDKYSIEKVAIEYLEHLKIFGYCNNLAKLFINSIRDSGVLCKNVKGWWEFKEHNTACVFIIEHSLDDKIEILKKLSKQFKIELNEENIIEEKVKVID